MNNPLAIIRIQEEIPIHMMKKLGITNKARIKINNNRNNLK